MAVEANDNNVRSRIDAIIDAREKSDVSKRRRKIGADKKPLVITLSILCVIIAGLVIAILAVSRPWDGGDEEGIPNIADTSENEVLIKCDDILYRIATDEEYTTDDAIADLAENIENEDGIYKIYATMCYANIKTIDTDEDFNDVVSRLQSIESLVEKEDVSVKIDYYVKLRTLYTGKCSSDQYSYYSKIIEDLSGDKDMVIGNPMQFELEEE